MKKKAFALVLALFTVFSLFSVFALPSSAAGTYFEDNAGVLTSSRAEEIEGLLKEVSDKYGCIVKIVTVNGQTDYTFENYAIELANALDRSYGKAVLFAHFPDIRAYQIEIRGATFSTDNVERAWNRITDAVVERLKADDIVGAYRAFASASDDCLEPLIAGKTVRDPYPYLRNIIIALVVGLIAGLIYTGKLKKQLTSVVKQERAANYVKNGSMNLTAQNDIFLYMHTTRTARPKDTGSRSGGGGFSSGGGRSSGGGGGGHY